jgi:hypothetical protein
VAYRRAVPVQAQRRPAQAQHREGDPVDELGGRLAGTEPDDHTEHQRGDRDRGHRTQQHDHPLRPRRRPDPLCGNGSGRTGQQAEKVGHDE